MVKYRHDDKREKQHEVLGRRLARRLGLRGFLSYLRLLLTAKDDTAYLNLFGSSTASVKLPVSGETVTLEQYSTYPNENHTFVWNRTEKPLDYTLAVDLVKFADAPILKRAAVAHGDFRAK